VWCERSRAAVLFRNMTTTSSLIFCTSCFSFSMSFCIKRRTRDANRCFSVESGFVWFSILKKNAVRISPHRFFRSRTRYMMWLSSFFVWSRASAARPSTQSTYIYIESEKRRFAARVRNSYFFKKIKMSFFFFLKIKKFKKK